MKQQGQPERRREQRVQARLQIELELEPGGETHASSTINVSANGAYFQSPRFIAPLTKLGLRLLLPEADPGGPERAVDCQGIVVRCVPDRPTEGVGQYEVACYFTDTSPDFKARLSHYVQNHL